MEIELTEEQQDFMRARVDDMVKLPHDALVNVCLRTVICASTAMAIRGLMTERESKKLIKMVTRAIEQASK